MKNYNLKKASNRENMIKKIQSQFEERVENLPAGTRQKVIIDIRGQVVPYRLRWEVYQQIRERTGRQMAVRFKIR